MSSMRLCNTFVLLLLFSASVCFGKEDSFCEADSLDNKEGCESQTSRMSSAQRYKALKENIEEIRKVCGELCDTTITGSQGQYYEELTKKVDCRALFENSVLDRPSEFSEPPYKVPKYLLPDFTYQGRVKVVPEYRDDANGKHHWLDWDLPLRDVHFRMFDEGTLTGSYGKHSIDRIYKQLTETMPVEGQHVLVIGSERPWLETTILKAGARHITTLDYTQINSTWPDVTAITPNTFGEMYLNGTLPKFDSIVTFSSVEHSGLGRYGDPLNPWGDLIALARGWCVLEPGSRALVGVPTGPDLLTFNSARIYGPVQYSNLFTNWKVVFSEVDMTEYSEDCHFCYQPLIVIEK